ncbi:hypothetical protein DSO57_1003651 [Entomophthora muscae]|uniref:Uncharacterized protein n=1 Tax=Entomophthora muscae TaxID=34485 RepID=A0ACC2SL56_9FUNG|nr:hypothetical protein DSO57_1003651 [Entomophthora muscae]
MQKEQTIHMPQQIDDFMSLKDIFAEGLTVLKVMRRFGCPLTRLEAMEFTNRHDEFAKLGVNVVGVGFDVAGMSEFILGNFWKGRLFVDVNRSLYRHLNLPRAGIKATLKCLINPKTRKKYKCSQLTFRRCLYRGQGEDGRGYEGR